MQGNIRAIHDLTKNPIKSGVIIVVFKLVSAILQFPAILFLTKSWTSEQMGVWLLLTSLGQIILITADMGLGQSLRLTFAKLDKFTKTNEGEKLLNSAISFLLVISGVFLGVFLVVFSIYQPEFLFTVVDKTLRSQINIVFVLFVGLNLISVPSMIIVQLYFAFHEPEKTVYYDFLRTIALFLLSILANSHNFLSIILVYCIFNTLTRLLQFFKFYISKKWVFTFTNFRQSFNNIRPYTIKSIEFWILSIAASIQISLFPWLIAQVMPASELGKLALIIQMMVFLLILHVSFFMPLQSKYTVASYYDVTKYLKNSYALTFVVTLVINTIFILIFPILAKFFGKIADFNQIITYFFAFWSLLWALINTSSIMLNGFGEIKPQIFGLVLSISIPYISIFFKWSKDIYTLFPFIIFGLVLLLLIELLSISNLLKALKYRSETW